MTGPGATGAVSAAQFGGLVCGQKIAQSMVERARTNLAAFQTLGFDLQQVELDGIQSLINDGLSVAQIEEWRIGYFEGVDSVVQPFLAEMRAANEFLHAQAEALTALTRMEAAAKRIGAHAKPSTSLPGLGSQKLGPLLRADDFGTLPMPRRP